jgi:hypothetical protein
MLKMISKEREFVDSSAAQRHSAKFLQHLYTFSKFESISGIVFVRKKCWRAWNITSEFNKRVSRH